MSRIYVAILSAVVLIVVLTFYAPLSRVAGQVQVQVPQTTNPREIEVTPSGTHIDIRNGKPLGILAMQLSDGYGVAVNYEDALNKSPAVFEDLTPPARRISHPEGFLQRRLIHWDVELKSSLTHDSFSGMVQFLEEAVKSYNASDPPEQFRVVVEGHPERVSLVAINIKDEGGVRVPVTPLLDQTVALPSTRQTVDEALFAIAEQLTADTGMKVVIGSTPMNLTNRLWYTPRPQVQSARLALEEINAISPLQLVWSVAYERWSDEWILNITCVGRDGTLPDGRPTISDVTQTPAK